jgi:DNA replication ATP-dependent helicase Dna2
MDREENIVTLGNQAIRIQDHELWTDYQKNRAWFELFTFILELATNEDRLNFTTLFSRLAFTGAKYQLSSSVLHLSHMFRKAHEQGIIKKETEQIYEKLGKYICSKLLHDIFKHDFRSENLMLSEDVASFFRKSKEKIKGFVPLIEAVLFEIDVENKMICFYDESDPSKEQKALYDIHDRNELFNANIDSLIRTFQLPIHVNFIDTDIREDGIYLPTGLVIHPDHMVDVTSVSECFKEYGAEPFLYLISKFKPAEATTSLMVGNLVNFMLDELIANEKISFKEILPSLFRQNPLGFSMLDDSDVKDLVNTLQAHFINLQYTVNQEFRKFGIEKSRIYLEPSFYSRDFGIQGRLDLLHQKPGALPAYDIIELKSGKTFKPNVYGINSSHYIQTLLYDLMIKSTFQTKTKSFNYILYSKEAEKSLRFAPPVRQQQYEAMKLRNDLMAIEQKLRNVQIDSSILRYIKPENFQRLKGFNQNDIQNFFNIYNTLDELEKAYFNNFVAFIAREHGLSKTGEHGINKSNGHAALWLESIDEKKDRFAILTHLTLIGNKSFEQDAFLGFERSAEDDTLVNFRVGDIAVLYPKMDDSYRTILQNQIFKCTIVKINSETIEVKLRSKQYNQSLFNNTQFWSIELDSLDSGFNSMYKNLFGFAAAPREYRDMILGRTSPRLKENHMAIAFDDSVTDTQKVLLEKMVKAKDYFLLWGPPGTGKTSVMLKNLVAHLNHNSKETILLLAYTNRAVDEICDAIFSLGIELQNQFLRIGSRLATDPKYQNFLLDQIISQVQSRNEIIQLLTSKRIFVSTVSSIVNRPELFQLKAFDTVIIDEASQILEPMLCGLLSNFKRFILIGDHKQLPAVVVQDGSLSRINDDSLQQIGIVDTRVSLFERLYFQCQKNEWNHAFGILNEQGRMHESLMSFVNYEFYENQLKSLPGLHRQIAPYFLASSEDHSLCQRKIFIDTPIDEDINWKTNLFEAQRVVEIISKLSSIYENMGKSLENQSIGVITPYRAQIAMIRKQMEVLDTKINSKITIDTVERYQGGARDIIIISFCVNRLSQLDSLISLSNEGIDRKLNVALTRAKEQIILIGNSNILTHNPIYTKLMASCDQLKY